MSELVDCVNRAAHGHVLIAAMTTASKTSKIDVVKLFGKGHMVDVVFKINGVDVPFEETVDNLFERQFEKIDSYVLEKAKELLSVSRFDRLSNKLSELEWQMEEELEKIQKELTND